jgi:RHS repeat-associated protein
LVLAGGVTRSFTYSPSGNVTVDDLAGSATNLTYNAADRLVQVSTGGIPLVDYVYGATGQRAIKATPTATTHYLYDPGGALYAETDGAGTVLREYITLGGATIAIVDAMGTSFVHNDHLATPQVMTDGTAAVVWDASYRPFGEATIAGAVANQQRFPGQTADAETGYSDNWYRTYDPSLGRYLQSDPIGLTAGFNTYAYVGGNPVMYADPTGEAIDVFLDIGFISYDVYRIYNDNIAGSCDNLGENLLALGADTLGAIIPFATGLGMAVRGGRYADDVAGLTDDVVKRALNKNSLDYVGDTHVYRIIGPDGSTFKIGQSARGVRVRDGASIRAEQQVRQLRRETSDYHRSQIRKVFPDKRSAWEYETNLIQRFRRRYGKETLPGNLGIH